MPRPNEHAKLSKLRTGKSFIELHKWMDEEYNDSNLPKRHDITKIPENLKIVQSKFGDGATQEFLYHINEDYEINRAYKLIKLLSTVKRTVFSPLNILKNN